MIATQTRRRFLATLSLTGAAGLLGAPPSPADEETLETTSVHLSKTPSICIAPQYIADELLRAEGFTDIRYVDLGQSTPRAQAIAQGTVDFSGNFVAPLIVAVASGEPVTFLAGMHVGCFELFGNDSVRSIADLKGKSVGVPALGSNQHIFLTAMVAHVGLDPVSDIHWVTSSSITPVEAFEQGKIDAFLGFPPEPQDLRARNVKHVVVNSALDRPWSEYFCCMLAGNSEYVRKYPGATNACCARSSRPPICARPSRHKSRGGSSMAASPIAMATRCRCSTSCPRTNGANTMPKTRFGSMHCGCTKQA
jgi:NitT/TauT family transport system substrate-binding protein